jgi:hypothetical protein
VIGDIVGPNFFAHKEWSEGLEELSSVSRLSHFFHYTGQTVQIVPDDSHDILIVLSVDPEALQTHIMGRSHVAKGLPDRGMVEEHSALISRRLHVERASAAQGIPQSPLPFVLADIPNGFLEQILLEIFFVAV